MKYFIFRVVLFLALLLINLYVSILLTNTFSFPENLGTFFKNVWMVSFYIFAYYFFKLLSRRMVTTNEVLLIFKANFLSLIAILFVVALDQFSEKTSQLLVFTFFGLNSFNFFWSYGLKKYFFQFNYFRKSVFVVCDTKGLKNIQTWFIKGNPFGYDITYILNVDEHPIKSTYKKIDTLVNEEQYDSAVIDLEENSLFQMTSLVDHIQRKVRRVIILPKMSQIPMMNGEIISSLHHKGMAFYIHNNLLSPLDRAIKQCFDIFVASLLIVICFPFLVWLYMIVSIATKGHPVFTHKRIGYQGKIFKVYKFRTMYLDSEKRLQKLLSTSHESKEEWEKNFKLKNDPRITKIGHFLRRTSLDELPQLINVLKGEMSLVGPRPITKEEIKKYGEYYEYFIAVKPGITGLWQVSGRNDIEYNERVHLDVWYVRNWSIELDIQILMKTFLVVLGRKGSY